MKHVVNAVISSVSLSKEERNLLSAWLHLDYGGSCQGFGGFALYLPKDFKHFTNKGDFAGHFIFRCLEIADVDSWDKLEGKTVRVELDKPGLGGLIIGIGHIIKDDWFYPREDFKKMSDNG